jgi:hypothetical protein
MDWKAVADATPFHKAKDVGAFANHLGGTLLIGAREDDGRLAAYVGLSAVDSAAAVEAYSAAVEQRCLPKPLVDFEEYGLDDGRKVLAVNVWPSLELVGVKVRADRAAEGWGGEAHVFPVRVGSHTTFLRPTEIAMYMTPHVRRAAVLLSKVPKDARVEIHVALQDGRAHTFAVILDEVVESENVVKFKDDNGRSQRSVPLDCVVTAFEDVDPTSQRRVWRMYVQYTR